MNKDLNNNSEKSYKISITDDKMKCILKIMYSTQKVSFSRIMKELKEMGIKATINEQVTRNMINSAYEQKESTESIVVARGRNPKLSEPEKIKFKTKFNKMQLSLSISNDFKSPKICSEDIVMSGDIIAEKCFGNLIKKGYDVFGKETISTVLIPGKGISLTRDNRYKAITSGRVVIENNKIFIVPEEVDNISISISADKLKAGITITKIDGINNIGLERIIKMLRNKEVVYGINKNAIQKNLDNLKEDNTDLPLIFTAASGEEVCIGEDAELILYSERINLNNSNIPKNLIKLKGEKDKSLFKPNDKIAELKKEIKNKDGKLVTGEVVKSNSIRRLDIYVDSNIRVEENREKNCIEYYAKSEGEIIIKGNTLILTPVRDAYFQINISKDKMSTTMDFYAKVGSGKDLDVWKCMEGLQDKGVVFGIDEKAIMKGIEKTGKGILEIKNILVASAQLPVTGKNGSIKYNFNRQTSKPTIDETGRANYYNLGNIPVVDKNSIIAEIIPPGKGVPGKNVMGEEIHAAVGKDIWIEPGENVVLSENGKKYISVIYGIPKVDNNIIRVKDVYVTKGDVDFSTGNIKYNGDIIVNGDVKSGFIVESVTGTAIIKGSVYDSVVKAKKGIDIGNGVIGKSKCKLISSGYIKAKFVENAILEAKGKIEIYNYILQSTITSGESIEVVNGKGLILGGQYFASEKIEAVTIGNELGIKTYLYAGQRYDLINKLGLLNTKISELKTTANDSMRIIEKLNNSPSTDIELLNQQLVKFNSKRNDCLSKIEYIQEIIGKIMSKINDSVEKIKGGIKVRGQAHIGTHIYIKNREFSHTSALRSAFISYDDLNQKISIDPLILISQ